LLASWRSLTKIAGSGSRSGSRSGSISQRHGSADPDKDPDPHQNVIDPKHWGIHKWKLKISSYGAMPCPLKTDAPLFTTLNAETIFLWFKGSR
jgi:hypothetical protein